MRYLSPIARVRIGDDVFESGDGLLRHAAVTLAEDDRASNCRFEIYDPGLLLAGKYFEMSYSEGGIQVPPDLLENPAAAASGGTINITGETQGVANVGSESLQGDELAKQIIAECHRQGVTDPGQIAYILATAQHESAMGKFMTELSPPNYEFRDDLGNVNPGDGAKYIGRGYVQITGRRNYTLYSQLTGKDLVNSPTLAATPSVGLYTLVHGMKTGNFTGAPISRYVNGSKQDFIGARWVVNGQDRAGLIAGYAQQWLPRIPQLGGQPPSFTQNAFNQIKEAAKAQPAITDEAETKPVEVSQKGTEIIIELGYQPSQLVAYHYIHTGTHTRGRMADSTVFEGQSIRWLMTRRTKNATYQSISLRELAERVATAHGLELEMEGDGPKYAHLDQSGITDYELLLRECRAIGYGISDKGRKLILKPRRPEFTGYVIDRQQLISIEFSDKAQKDKQVAPGGSLTSPEVPAAEAKAKINRLSGMVEQIKPEDSTATGKAGNFLSNALTQTLATLPEKDSETGRAPNFAGLAMSKLVAITGSAQGEMSGTPAPESAAKAESGEQTPSTVGLPSQQIGAIALSTGTAQAAELKAEAQRVKGYPGSAVVIASPESLTLAPGSILGISPDCVPDAFAREYRVASVTHTLSAGGFVSNVEYYTPQAAKKAEGGAINLTGDETAPAGAPGKLLNPMPNSPRGTPFDPGGAIRRRAHWGIDLADYGAVPIFAAEAGTVIDVENSCRVGDRGCGGGFGNLVYIKHSGQWEGWVTRYAHLSRTEVSIGQTVARGQIIGRQGNTGSSGGDHLHFEVLNPGGTNVDPEPLIRPSPTGVYGQGVGYPIRT